MPNQARFKIQALLRLGRLLLTCPRALSAARQVRQRRLSFLNPAALIDLADAAGGVQRRGVAGAFLEAGCALGGSAIVIAAAKPAGRPLWVYDTFERIPPPGLEDGAGAVQRFDLIQSGQAQGLAGEAYYGYRGDLVEEVRANFAQAGLETQANQVFLVKGLYQDTLHPDGPVAFAHLDCDWHDSVLTCLERIEPRLSLGGVLVIDDYEHWSGCRKAVDEYFAQRRERYQFTFKSRLHIQRTGI